MQSVADRICRSLGAIDGNSCIGIDVKPLYTPADLESIGFDYLRDLGFPGEYPFTRGAIGPIVLAMFAALGEKRGIP